MHFATFVFSKKSWKTTTTVSRSFSGINPYSNNQLMMNFILEMQFSLSLAMFSELGQEEICKILYFTGDFSIILVTIAQTKFFISSYSERTSLSRTDLLLLRLPNSLSPLDQVSTFERELTNINLILNF